jgi:hypothetical protein
MSVHEAQRRLAKSQAKHDLTLAIHEVCDANELSEVEQLEVVTKVMTEHIDLVLAALASKRVGDVTDEARSAVD